MATPEDIGAKIEEILRRLAALQTPPAGVDPLMNLAHVAEVLDVSVDHVRNLVRRGDLIAHDITPDAIRRNLRVRQSDLAAYISKLTGNA